MIKPTILVLGTHHFSGEDNGDLFRSEQENMLSQQRQDEIQEVVDCLKNFRPTKVALEVLEKSEGILNDEYISYINENYTLGVNECDQIGYRLAKQCNLEQVHAVDWNENQEGVPEMSDLSGLENGEQYEAALQIGQDMMSQMEAVLQNNTYKDFLLWLNDSEQVARGHELYMKMALAGSNDDPVGVLWTAKYWYFRNMLIYKNLVNLIDSGNERIFVLYGSGHLHLLLQFLKESNLFEVKVASDYLS